MARIKLKATNEPLWKGKIPVRITDVNYGNHAGNDSIVSIIHEARVQWLQSLQLSEMDIGGSAIIMASLHVDYKKEIFYPETLTVEISKGDITTSGFEVYYVFKNSAGETAVIARTDIVCFDYTSRKVVPVPESFVQILTP